MWFHLSFLVLCGYRLAACARNNTGEFRLFNDIMKGNNPYERPRYNKSESVTVLFEFNLQSVSHFDEARQQLVCSGYFVMSWVDEFLRWDPKLYDGTEFIRPPDSYVWTPDIVAANSFQQLDSLGGNFVSLKLYSSGFVLWMPGDLFNIPCNVDIQRYPFDSLVYYLELEVWSHSVSEVVLKPTKESAGTDKLQLSGQWSLMSPPSVQPKSNTANNQTESRVVITLKLSRSPTNFIFSFILPVLILSLLGTFVFLIPSDSGEKISFAITIPLSYGVYMGFLTTMVPQMSQGVSIFVIYLGLTIILAALYVILSIYSVHISRRQSRVISKRFQKITFWVETLKNCGRRQQISDVSSLDDRDKERKMSQSEPMTWMRVSKAIDLLFFWTFSLPIFVAIPSMIFFICFQ